MSESTQNNFDLLLKGGHVIDPKNNIDQAMDVGIADGKIGRVAENIPEAEAEQGCSCRWALRYARLAGYTCPRLC